MLTKQQICKLNDVEPTENVLKAMHKYGFSTWIQGVIIGAITAFVSLIFFSYNFS